MFLFSTVVIGALAVEAEIKDAACEARGGTCLNWKHYKCTAGYEQGLCSGDSDRRCCLNCDAQCIAWEEQDSQGDGYCNESGGECKHETNYCNGNYNAGMCGGPSERKCCLSSGGGGDNGGNGPLPEFNVGDIYWNHYGGYALSRYATSTGYSYGTLKAAQDRCIELGDLCSGVTRENSSSYTVRGSYKFVSSWSMESWTKEVVFSDKFVPRPQWGAREPNGITSFSIPASHGVIGHHTAGSQCFSYDECVSNVRATQNYHMNSLGWSDVGYNFLIGEDGYIYEGRGFYRQGAHCSNWNSITLGFSVMGDFSYKLPNKKALDAVDILLNHMEEKGYVNSRCYEFSGHRDHGSTICPGDPLYAHWGSGKYQSWHKRC